MRDDEAEEKQRPYGHVMIGFGAEDMGYWYSYAEFTVADRGELEDILKRLEGVIKRTIDRNAQAGDPAYGPLKDPREYLEEVTRQHREYEEDRAQERQK